MKYNTISTSSLSSEGRKSTLTLYTDSDFIKEKAPSETEIASIRGELEIVQRALKTQTRRCKQLVAEYTKRLQEKEQQYQSEKLLRDDQLAKVLRALLIFEARLKQEQKIISHQLNEKDYVIKKQREKIDRLSNQYCKHCNQFYTPARNLESLDSSSEYVATDYQDYSNFESLDSSSETYATVSLSDFAKNEEKTTVYLKNKAKDGFTKRGRKFGHRKSVGTYFEVLKLRSDNPSPNQSSNEDNTSNDYENLESLPGESVSDKISAASDRIEGIFTKCTDLTEDNLDKFNESAKHLELNESNKNLERLHDNDKNSKNLDRQCGNSNHLDEPKHLDKIAKKFDTFNDNSNKLDTNLDGFDSIPKNLDKRHESPKNIEEFHDDNSKHLEKCRESVFNNLSKHSEKFHENSKNIETLNETSRSLENIPSAKNLHTLNKSAQKLEEYCDANDNVVRNNLQKGSNSEYQESTNNSDQHETTNDDEKDKASLSKINENIPVFEGDGETNDNWYASASDQEDDEQRDIYRNNPVLECMNQILLQNISDNINSPPKTPTVDRKQIKTNKRVKFSDEENQLVLKENVVNSESVENGSNYYEIPIQKIPNFYETPQSIYSNDYEQIVTQSLIGGNENLPQKLDGKENYYYVDMDTKSEIETEVVRKTKIIRTPPALPPKPANLLSRYKINIQNQSPKKNATPSIDSDPDYCSISELNLPTHKISAKKLNVVAEINIPNSQDVKNAEKHVILHSPKQKDLNDASVNSLIIPKTVEKITIQIAKHTPIKSSINLNSPNLENVKLTNTEVNKPHLDGLKVTALEMKKPSNVQSVFSSGVEIKNLVNADVMKTSAFSSSVDIKKSNADAGKSSQQFSSGVEMKKSPSSKNNEGIKAPSKIPEGIKSTLLTNNDNMNTSALSGSVELKKSSCSSNVDIVKPLAFSSGVELKKSPLKNADSIKLLALPSNLEKRKSLPLISSEIIKNSSLPASIEIKKTPSEIIKPKVLSSCLDIKKPPNINSSLEILKSPISSNAEIPKLPQVSEIIIPEEETEAKKEDRITHDNYIKNNSQMLKTKPNRRSILIGSSVSSLINTFNNQQLFSEMNKYKQKPKPFANFDQAQNSDKRAELKTTEPQNFDKFDLSQNFEEFKLDDCEIEEYNSVDLNEDKEIEYEFKNEEHVLPDILPSPKKASTHVEIVRATIPQLNPATVQQLKKKLELEKTNLLQDKELALTQKQNEPSYEHFLECTGLSSKSILTPSRLLSNHKSVLKPKDVKLRSKVKSSALDNKQTSTIKYWSEPYI